MWISYAKLVIEEGVENATTMLAQKSLRERDHPRCSGAKQYLYITEGTTSKFKVAHSHLLELGSYHGLLLPSTGGLATRRGQTGRSKVPLAKRMEVDDQVELEQKLEEQFEASGEDTKKWRALIQVVMSNMDLFEDSGPATKPKKILSVGEKSKNTLCDALKSRQDR